MTYFTVHLSSKKAKWGAINSIHKRSCLTEWPPKTLPWNILKLKLTGLYTYRHTHVQNWTVQEVYKVTVWVMASANECWWWSSEASAASCSRSNELSERVFPQTSSCFQSDNWSGALLLHTHLVMQWWLQWSHPSFSLGPAPATLTRDPLQCTSALKWNTHSEHIGCFGQSWAVWLGFGFQISLWLIHFLLWTKATQIQRSHVTFPFWFGRSQSAASIEHLNIFSRSN